MACDVKRENACWFDRGLNPPKTAPVTLDGRCPIPDSKVAGAAVPAAIGNNMKTGIQNHSPAPSKGRAARVEQYAVQNRVCAEVILENLQRYGGPESLMGQWAHAVLHGSETTERRWRLVA